MVEWRKSIANFENKHASGIAKTFLFLQLYTGEIRIFHFHFHLACVQMACTIFCLLFCCKTHFLFSSSVDSINFRSFQSKIINFLIIRNGDLLNKFSANLAFEQTEQQQQNLAAILSDDCYSFSRFRQIPLSKHKRCVKYDICSPSNACAGNNA